MQLFCDLQPFRLAGLEGFLVGHDGHSAMLCGLALLLEGRRVGKNVHLIFQAAEETGEGARQVIDTWPELKSLRALYALHNIPGFPEGALLMRRGCFACASCGVITPHMRLKVYILKGSEYSSPW